MSSRWYIIAKARLWFWWVDIWHADRAGVWAWTVTRCTCRAPWACLDMGHCNHESWWDRGHHREGCVLA